jgi:polygalacturonase
MNISIVSRKLRLCFLKLFFLKLFNLYSMKLLVAFFFFIEISLVNITCLYAQEYNIVKYGAKQGSNSTQAIQDALDVCEKEGGGTVIVPAGHYISGTIFMRSNVELHLNQNAVIEGSLEKKDYKERSLIMCDEINNASITGPGLINGNGENEVFQESNKQRVRPHIIFLRNSKHISVTGVSLRNAAFWCFRIFGSEDIRISGISIYNHAVTNNDGIDIDGKNITISNCIIDAEDDAICLKSQRTSLCENVVVSNCVIASDCNPIKMGTESLCGFKNIAISNCVVHKSAESSPSQKRKGTLTGIIDTLGISGIALEIVDGGTMDQITITNISMTDIQTPIFIRLGNRNGNNKSVVKNILISNINAKSESYLPCSITGIEGHNVENITLRDIIVQCKGLGTLEQANLQVPEKDKAYPENRMFGMALPAYGLYVRHVTNLTINNFQLRLLNPDERPAMIFDDVDNLTVNQLQADVPGGTQSLVWLNQVRNATFSGYFSSQPLNLFAKVTGDKTSRLHFINNNFFNVRKISDAGKEVNLSTLSNDFNF